MYSSSQKLKRDGIVKLEKLYAKLWLSKDAKSKISFNCIDSNRSEFNDGFTN